MSDTQPALYKKLEELVDNTISIVGKNVVLGLPIGLGKPIHIANEFYRRAKNGDITLTICSGLTLEAPRWNSELERRMIEPLVKRLFPEWPKADYMDDMRAKKLPDNVTIREFYCSPGAFLDQEHIQQNYVSSNYTHVARDMLLSGSNVCAVVVADGEYHGRHLYSLGGNCDAALNMIDATNDAIARGEKCAVIGLINDRMPYTFGGSLLEPSRFTALVDDPALYHNLFAAPHEPITSAEYFIGLNASAIIKDGGTFQVGFGSLGDALTYALLLRQEKNDLYNKLLGATDIATNFSDEIARMGDTGTFEKGLYACTEFYYDGFIKLMRSGVIKRKVYDNEGIQRLIINEKITEKVTPKTLELLAGEDAIHQRLTERDFNMLTKFGVLRDGLSYSGGVIHCPDGESIPADLGDPKSMDKISKHCLGDSLLGGTIMHTGFFLGSQAFYDDMMNMPADEKELIQMREITFVNQLYGSEELKRLQRRAGRFVNTAMMASALGAVISETIDSGQIVSGVGGQYNFVSMAHALEDARSIILIRSTRMKGAEPVSNVVWQAVNATIPRHLRDVVVSEYGIADLRGRSDSQCIAAILNITDSRFQNELLRKAKENKKIPHTYTIPVRFRNNLPERLEKQLAPFKKEALFPVFPFGCEFTPEELVLGRALRNLKARMSLKGFKLPPADKIGSIVSAPAAAKPFLERMGLDKTSSMKENIMRSLVLFALVSDGAV